MTGKIEQFLTSNIKSVFPDFSLNTSFFLMKIKSRGGKCSSALFYLFINSENKPRFLIKINRAPGYFEAIENEYKNLKNIHEKAVLRGLSVPEPKFCERFEDNVIFCETFVEGEPYLQILSREPDFNGVSNYLESALTWLLKLQSVTKTEDCVIDDSWIKKNAVHPVELFLEDHKDIDPDIKEFLLKLPKSFREYTGITLPVVASQGDFDQWNIFIDDGKISVVDWEDCKLQSSPYEDLFMLLFHMALLHNPKSCEQENFNAFFEYKSGSYNTFSSMLDLFSKNYNLPVKLFFLLAPIYVIDTMNKKYPNHRDPKSWPLNNDESLKLVVNLARRELKNVN